MKRGDLLRLVGGLLVVAGAVLRCVVTFGSSIIFDTDPAVASGTIGGLGPAGSLLIDVAIVLGCAVALLGEHMTRRGVCWTWLLLAFAPVPLALWQGAQHLDDMWRGVSWCSAALAFATMAHLAREAAMRRLLLALMIGVFGPLLVRGGANVSYEHDDKIATFEMRKDALFAERGWTADSPSAVIYERRLRQRQPTGWFLTTNILATFLAMGIVLGVGAAIAGGRGGASSGWVGLPVILALACVGGLAMSGSKGALFAAGGGVVLLVAPLIVQRLGMLATRTALWIGLAGVLATVGAVALRGAALPEALGGEKSLLFRWHYVVASGSIVAENPVLGVGAGGYQDAYTKHRIPRNPEEVASAHNASVDWLCAFGLFGAAWVALGVLALRRAGEVATLDEPGGELDVDAETRRVGAAALPVALLGVVHGMLIEIDILDGLELAVRGTGAAAYVITAIVAARLLACGERTAIRWTLFAALVTMAVHVHIEMTLAQPGAVTWLLAMAALIAPVREVAARRVDVAAPITCAALAVWLAVTAAVPAYRQERVMIDAARPLWPIARARQGLHLAAVTQQPNPLAESMLIEGFTELGLSDAEMHTLGVIDVGERGITPNAHRAITDRLARAEVERRPGAVRRLLEAEAVLPSSPLPRLAAARQRERVIRHLQDPAYSDEIRDGLADTRHLIDRFDDPRAIVLAIRFHEVRAEHSVSSVDLDAAIALRESLTERDPNGNTTWLRLADLYWHAGRRGDAAGAYRRAIECDDAFELDEMKQFPGRDRARAEERAASTP